MKKEITVSAKSVDEAVAKAVAALGAPSADKIEYTVLEEAKKGFLGIGATDAKIWLPILWAVNMKHLHLSRSFSVI